MTVTGSQSIQHLHRTPSFSLRLRHPCPTLLLDSIILKSGLCLRTELFSIRLAGDGLEGRVQGGTECEWLWVVRDTWLTQFGLNLKLTKKTGGTPCNTCKKHLSSSLGSVWSLFPQMEDDVEVELELEKQVDIPLFIISSVGCSILRPTHPLLLSTFQ